MIGAVFGVGTGSIDFANIPHKQVKSIQIPNPAESLFGRLTIADDSSPLPRDRLFVDYDYFNDVPFSPYGANTSRVTTGVEKTFFGSSDKFVRSFMNGHDFEDEEVVVAKAVGLSLHGLDLVVSSFQRAC
jgi:hypothetical protein